MVVVDKSKEMNERLLLEVRRRLQAAKSQLNTAPASEADMGTPVDSPLGGRPTVLQGRGHSGMHCSTPVHKLCVRSTFRKQAACCEQVSTLCYVASKVKVAVMLRC